MKRFSIVIVLVMMVSFLGFSQNDGKPKKTPEERAQLLTARMEKELALSTEQVEKIKAINLASAKKVDELRKNETQDKSKRHEEMSKINDARDVEFKGILTSDQYAKYELLIKEMKDKRKDKPAHGNGA